MPALTPPPLQCSFMEYRGMKVVYRRYASLYFIVGFEADDEVGLRVCVCVCVCAGVFVPLPCTAPPPFAAIRLADHGHPRDPMCGACRSATAPCRQRTWWCVWVCIWCPPRTSWAFWSSSTRWWRRWTSTSRTWCVPRAARAPPPAGCVARRGGGHLLPITAHECASPLSPNVPPGHLTAVPRVDPVGHAHPAKHTPGQLPFTGALPRSPPVVWAHVRRACVLGWWERATVWVGGWW
jgi:hypothetical protein